MPIVFEVQPQDISDLSDLNLTRLLKMLLHLEAKSSGIAQRAVEVALNIRVADGGEDGRIEWNGGPGNTDFLPCRLVQFQNKATNMGVADCANELIGADGELKPMVEQALDNDGAYILFTTQLLNNQQKQARINAIRDKLNQLGKTYATTVTIDIYDAAKIQGWANHYAPSITAVLNWVGRPLVNGLHTWDEWEKFDENHLFDYVADEARNEAIKGLRELLVQPKRCARIIGLSGLGKTRLALEVCRGDNDEDGFSKRVVYIDAAYGEPNLAGLISSWVRHGLDGMIVVDNCELTLHKQIRREIEHPDSKLSLLTLHYNPEKDPDTDPVQLGFMSDELIKSMLEPVYGDKITDLDRIVKFAQGFPQMAVLLAKARLDQTKDMGSLTDDDLVKKLLWGGGEQDPNAEGILQACSLFDKFGLEEEAEIESKFIAENIVGTDEDSLYKCIKAYEQRGVINSAGRFCQVIPKPLAIRLAADWWRTTRRRRQEELIEAEMPGQLERSFCTQITMLGFLPNVTELTAELCGEQRPFGQAEVILSDRGSRLFRALVEVNPDATSDSLYRVMKTLSNEHLREIKGDVRRNLVWALEKLCFHANVFEKSAKCLLWLASEENENWSNNATGQFLQIFRVFLSGNGAPPGQRLALIDEALVSDKIQIRKLAVEALGTAIDSRGGSRTIGAEYQGTGKPLEEWRPKIWQEAFDYWEAALDRLTNITLKHDEISEKAKAAIASNIRGLMQNGRVDALDKAIKLIVEADGPLWPNALSSINDSLSFDSDQMPELGKNKLNEWIKLLTPTQLNDRIELIVCIPPYVHEKDHNDEYIDVAANNARSLAQELSGNIDVLVPHLGQLLTGEQRQGYTFGQHLVLTAGKWEPLLTEAMSYLEKNQDANLSFVLGMLNGVFQIDTDQWEAFITKFSGEDQLVIFYPHMLSSGKVYEKHLEQVIELIESNKLDETAASVFVYGKILDHLEEPVVLNFVDKLRNTSPDAAWVSLDILFMYCYRNKDRWKASADTFKEILLVLPLHPTDKKKQREMHQWKTTIDAIWEYVDSDFITMLMQKIWDSCKEEIDYGDLRHYIKPVTRKILANYGKEVWPIIAARIRESDRLEEYHLSELFSSEDSFDKKQTSVLADLPEEVLHEWCKSEPDFAPVFLAESVDVYLENDAGYSISPRAQFLIDEFGDNEKVLRALSVKMGSFGWSGSLVPYFEKEVVALEPLLNHSKEAVREWADRRISYLKKGIEKESARDAEEEWGIY